MDASPGPGRTDPAPDATTGTVVAVARDGQHRFSKPTVSVVRMVPGLGVEGDAHHGRTVQHLSRLRRDPTQPNLRQVHLVAAELLTEVAEHGHRVAPGELGENVTTGGLDLLSLPVGTVLRLGPEAEVELTGLRNPCRQIDGLSSGLLARVLGREEDGSVRRRAGVMSVVRRGGEVRPGDPVVALLPPGPAHVPRAGVSGPSLITRTGGGFPARSGRDTMNRDTPETRDPTAVHTEHES